VRDYGTLKKIETDVYLWHIGIAITPQRVNLGILHAEQWQRPETPVAHLRDKKPIEEKESYRWLAGYDVACQAQASSKTSLVVNIADREGDIHEWFSMADKQSIDHRADYIIRAKCNRRLEQEDPDENHFLWEKLGASPCLGTLKITTPRRTKKPSRKVTLSINAQEITLTGRQGNAKHPITLYAVYAKEMHSPKNSKGIEWMLLTSLQTIIGWYVCRWEIELYFNVLKQGCQIEKLRLETANRLENAIGVYLIVAWRIHNITLLSRVYGEQSCEMVYEKKEWRTIYTMSKKKKPPKKPPDLKEVTRMLAQLGGFLARKNDGEPGAKTIWVGYEKLIHYMEAFEIMAAL